MTEQQFCPCAVLTAQGIGTVTVVRPVRPSTRSTADVFGSETTIVKATTTVKPVLFVANFRTRSLPADCGRREQPDRLGKVDDVAEATCQG
jgi:hypothetical protein